MSRHPNHIYGMLRIAGVPVAAIAERNKVSLDLVHKVIQGARTNTRIEADIEASAGVPAGWFFAATDAEAVEQAS